MLVLFAFLGLFPCFFFQQNEILSACIQAEIDENILKKHKKTNFLGLSSLSPVPYFHEHLFRQALAQSEESKRQTPLQTPPGARVFRF